MQIRNLLQSELHLLHQYTLQEGWDNEELHVQALFHAYSKDFFIAYKDEKLIGFIVAIKYTNNFGFISDFLVLKEFRSQSYGKKIFLFALKHLEGCQIALDTTSSNSSLFQEHSFLSYYDVNLYIFVSGSVTLPKSPYSIVDFNKELSIKGQDKYMSQMLVNTSASYKAIQTAKNISSFGFLFAYKDGYKIHIDSQDINEALSLFFALIEQLTRGTKIYMQITQLTPLLEALAELLKMHLHSKQVRMYNKVLP